MGAGEGAVRQGQRGAGPHEAAPGRTESEGNGEKKTTDTDKPETLSPDEHAGLSAMLKAVFTVELTKEGKIGEVTVPDEVVAATVKSMKAEGMEGGEDRIRKMIVGQTRPFLDIFAAYQPPGAVFIGQTWATERKSPEGGTGTKAECKLVRVERTPAGRVAIITFKLRPDPNAAGPEPRGSKKARPATTWTDSGLFPPRWRPWRVPATARSR